MLWGSLVADCEVTIQSPLITSRGNAITLKRGRLCLQKPGMVNLTVPASGSLQLRLVGDGQAYRVDMPCFRDAYTGAYGDPVVRTRNRIHFPPDDLAHAFDPLLLIAQGVPMVHHVGMMSYIESLELVEEPREQVQFASTVVFNRLRGQVVEIVKYEPDQTARVRMNYRALQLVSTGDEGQTTPIPYRITMSYLGEQAIIDILLSNIKLNEKLDPALFNVPAPAR